MRTLSRACVAAVSVVMGYTLGCSDKAPATTPDHPLDAGTERPDAEADAARDGARDAAADGVTEQAAPTLIVEPDQGMAPVYALMTSAKKTLDMTMYEDRDPRVTTLLTGLQKSGVAVRVILDQNLEMKGNTTAYDALAAGGVAVHWADKVYSATHQKTITVDGTTSAIMTLNLDPEYYSTSREFAVVTTDPTNVAAIEATFGADFASTGITPATGDGLVWSPTNSQTALVDLIQGATASLMIENEEMSYDVIVSALVSAAMRGVAVQVTMTASKEWDANFATLTAAGVKVVTYASDASLYIHAKVILADYGKPAANLYIGSENFSDASLNYNRELGLIFHDPAILTTVHSTLTSDFAGGTPYP